MAGNAWEWCHDWYGGNVGTTVDPAGPATGSTRMLRGGGFGTAHFGAGTLRAAARSVDRQPSYRFQYIGGRCARTMP